MQIRSPKKSVSFIDNNAETIESERENIIVKCYLSININNGFVVLLFPYWTNLHSAIGNASNYVSEYEKMFLITF